MNSSSSSDSRFLIDYGAKYILTTFSAFCTITNALNVVILLSKQLKSSTYQYLLWKSFFEMLLGFDSIFSFLCYVPSLQQTLLGQIYYDYFVSFVYYILLYAASMVDIAIAYDRILILKNSIKRSKLLDAKNLISIVSFISLVACLPIAFRFYIVPPANNQSDAN